MTREEALSMADEFFGAFTRSEMVEMRRVETAAQLSALAGDFEPETPVIWAEHAMSEPRALEAGELRLDGETHLLLADGGPR